MESMFTNYQGDLRTESTHLRSGKTVITDAPPDNQGKGEAFSPTDMLCVALTTCMSTLMGIAARTHGIRIEGMRMGIEKIMLSNPRRVGEIKVEVEMPDVKYSDKEKSILELAARTCPVALSLHQELKQNINFIYKD
jgi:uncharacterized OsmC-like protein